MIRSGAGRPDGVRRRRPTGCRTGAGGGVDHVLLLVVGPRSTRRQIPVELLDADIQSVSQFTDRRVLLPRITINTRTNIT